MLLCICKLHKSVCRCQTCLLLSQRDSGRGEKRWREGMFVHCAQPHRASEVCTFLFLSAEISLERGHLKQRQKSSKSELCTALGKDFETEGGKKEKHGKGFFFSVLFFNLFLFFLCFHFAPVFYSDCCYHAHQSAFFILHSSCFMSNNQHIKWPKPPSLPRHGHSPMCLMHLGHDGLHQEVSDGSWSHSGPGLTLLQ